MPSNNPEDTARATSNVGITTSGVTYYYGPPSTCPLCGNFLIGNHACGTVDYGQGRYTAPQWVGPLPVAPQRPCDHCFCEEMLPYASQKPHLACCMCATRKLK